MFCPLYLEIDETKIYGEILYKKLSFLYKQSCHYLEMSLLTKCLSVMRVMRGIQTVMRCRQGLLIIIERSIIGGGLILLMACQWI